MQVANLNSIIISIISDLQLVSQCHLAMTLCGTARGPGTMVMII